MNLKCLTMFKKIKDRKRGCRKLEIKTRAGESLTKEKLSGKIKKTTGCGAVW